MTPGYGALAALIEFGGALVIAAHVGLAAWHAARRRAPGEAAAIASRGLVAGLDFKLAATLLKTIGLASWHQIGLFAAIFALRLFVKKTMAGRGAPGPARSSAERRPAR